MRSETRRLQLPKCLSSFSPQPYIAYLYSISYDAFKFEFPDGTE